MQTSALRETLLSHKEIIEEVIQNDAYRFQRYDIPFSIAIFHADNSEALDSLDTLVRQTDKTVRIDKNFSCVIFGCVGHEDAFKASENLLHGIARHFPKVKLSAGLTSVTHMDDSKDMLYRAMNNLNFAMHEKMSSVEDDSVIEYLVFDNFDRIS